jgi:hypothetical protein
MEILQIPTEDEMQRLLQAFDGSLVTDVPERFPISKSLFFTTLDKNINLAVEQVQHGQRKVYEFLSMKEQVEALEGYDMRVDYFASNSGELLYEAREKDRMGFLE